MHRHRVLYLMLRRAILLLVLVLSGGTSQAAPFFPCPAFTAGWAKSYYNQPISSVMYDMNTQLLYVIFGNTFASAYSNVPTSIMQTFSQSTNVMQTYTTYVIPRYHALLLAETNNCPLLYETGAYIWSN